MVTVGAYGGPRKINQKLGEYSIPRCCMYGLFSYMKGGKWPHSKGNVGKYSLHGASGIDFLKNLQKSGKIYHAGARIPNTTEDEWLKTFLDLRNPEVWRLVGGWTHPSENMRKSNWKSSPNKGWTSKNLWKGTTYQNLYWPPPPVASRWIYGVGALIRYPP